MRPVFIGGTGRCGTTILRQCMAQHSKTAAMPGELRIVVDSGGVMDLYSDLTERWGPYRSDYAIWRFKKLMRDVAMPGGNRYQGHHMDQWVHNTNAYWNLVEEFVDDLVRHETQGTWTGSTPGRDTIYEAGPLHPDTAAEKISDFLAGLFELRNPRAEVWLDDTPYSIRHMKLLWTIFPDMTMIHIVRHPYDVLASYNRIRTDSRRWTSGSHIENAHRIRNCLDSWDRSIRSLRGHPGRLLHFEELVKRPRVALQKVCDWAHLPHETGLDQPVNPEKAHVGRRDFEEQGLTLGEIDDVRALLDPVCERFGYETP